MRSKVGRKKTEAKFLWRCRQGAINRAPMRRGDGDFLDLGNRKPMLNRIRAIRCPAKNLERDFITSESETRNMDWHTRKRKSARKHPHATPAGATFLEQEMIASRDKGM